MILQIHLYIIQNQYINMLNERGIRVPEKLKNKIKRAAVFNNMKIYEYLDSIVPDIRVDEDKKPNSILAKVFTSHVEEANK